MHALFKDGKQISKAHPTVAHVLVEAAEIGALLRSAADFGTVQVSCFLAPGYSIRSVSVAA